MIDALWNGIQYISDKWITQADEDAVREHFQGNASQKAAENKMAGFANQPTLRRPAHKGFRWMTIAACACLCLCATVFFQRPEEPINTPLKMESSVMEVSSSAEMGEYLGFTVPVLESKEAAAYILYTSNEYAETGSIIYDDGSSFQIAREDHAVSDNSYIVENISGVDVHFGWEDGRPYAAWTYNGYSCRYYDYDVGGATIFPNSYASDHKQYKDEISSLILQLK